MRVSCSAPGKVILFGEHAVVYGEPAMAVAVNKRTTCTVSTETKNTKVNGRNIQERYHSYILHSIERAGIDMPLNIETNSDLPSGAGMGSSAAVTVSTMGCLKNLSAEIDEKEIARDSFEVEWDVQGGASPIDTSTSTHGSSILLSNQRLSDFLWKIEKEKERWYAHHRDIPAVNIVVGDTGVHSRTGPLVRKVRSFYEKSNFARDIVKEIGEIVKKASTAFSDENLERIGELMDENQRLLSILGVSHPKLERLIKGARKYSYGAKLTGAGGGGSMVAITERPEKVAEEIESRGGTPYMLESTPDGLITVDA